MILVVLLGANLEVTPTFNSQLMSTKSVNEYVYDMAN